MLSTQTLAKDRLTQIHQDIVADYPTISHISRAELQSLLTAKNTLILDTRPLKEYNVSHIPGALQVDPKMDVKSFEVKFSSQLKDKTIIVYCSVGRRSSILGERIQQTALKAGALGVQNMEGGLFGWRNDNRPLENSVGLTTLIHPYNIFWGRLVEDSNSLAYTPK